MGFAGDLPFELSLPVVSGYGFLHLSPSAAGGSVSDDNGIGHLSMGMSEYG